MAGLSTAMKNSIGDMLYNQTNITAPTAIFLSLHTADPGATGASEVSGSAYARVNVTAMFSASASGAVTNDVQIDFPEVTTSSYTATHWGLWSASSGGTYYHGGDVNPDKLHAVGSIPSFAVGELDVTIT
jgi:hypothetical protein